MIESIMCIGVSPPPQKYLPSFLPGPLFQPQAVQGPPLISPYIMVFRELPHKNRIFQWTRIIFILNPIQPFKINKFLIKIFQFIRLVMRKKKFVCKLLFLLHISDFSLFLCKNCHPLKKVTPPLSSKTRPKIEILLKPSFWKFGRRSKPLAAEGGGASYGIWA